MFKRANKVTALLVAAASIMSVVPAMAAERIGNKEGTVKQGIAYGEGQYSYYGYRTDDDNTGIWYNDGKGAKDKTNDDLEDYEYSANAKFGDKYAYATNDGTNNDEYLIDLSTGKIVDDETIEEKEDSAKSSLYSAIKKADRYHGLAATDGTFTRVLQGQFGDVWYQYTTTNGAYYNDTTQVRGEVFVQEKGSSHIDASITANMYVYSSLKQKTVKIEDYNKLYDDAALKVTLSDIKVLAQDKDYLYTLTTVLVDDTSSAALVNKADGAQQSTQYFIQKISKAKDGKEDGVNLPKSVESFQLNKGQDLYDNGDSETAYKVLNNLDSDYTSTGALVAVKDGVLYVAEKHRGADQKIKIWTIKLSKVKADSNVDDGLTSFKVDTYLAKKTDDDDHDVADKATAITVDTEGTIWILNKGTISKYDGGEFKSVYTCDRSMDSLDVYNEGNLIAWDSAGDVYTTVQEGKKQTVDEAVVVDPDLGKTTPATVGWKQEAAGWTFYDVNGTKTASYWVNDNGTWYYIKADGIMATGWQQVNGTWYYLKSNGAMATGWLNDNGTWYYLASSGAMLANTTVDGYKLGASGAWVK